MSTLLDTILPEESYIKSIFGSEFMGGITELEYVNNLTVGIVSILKGTPTYYKAFGPWWPAVKRIIITSGNYDFGQNIDSDVEQIYSYSSDALTLLAATLYSTERLNDHVIDDAYHYLAVSPAADDTEPYLYVSTDTSVDKYGLNGSIL